MKISKVTENFALKIYELDYIFFCSQSEQDVKTSNVTLFFVKAIQKLVHAMYFFK